MIAFGTTQDLTRTLSKSVWVESCVGANEQNAHEQFVGHRLQGGAVPFRSQKQGSKQHNVSVCTVLELSAHILTARLPYVSTLASCTSFSLLTLLWASFTVGCTRNVHFFVTARSRLHAPPRFYPTLQGLGAVSCSSSSCSPRRGSKPPLS